jgi:DNA-binding transcriptional LysR family regulator
MSDPNRTFAASLHVSATPVATRTGRHESRPSHLASLAQLQAFVAAVEHGSFTKAAGAIGISQPAISELVRRLEADLEVHLLRRGGGVFAMTPAGERLLPHALQAVTSAQAAALAVR